MNSTLDPVDGAQANGVLGVRGDQPPSATPGERTLNLSVGAIEPAELKEVEEWVRDLSRHWRVQIHPERNEQADSKAETGALPERAKPREQLRILEWHQEFTSDGGALEVPPPAVFIFPRGARVDWHRLTPRLGWEFVSRPMAHGELAWRATRALRGAAPAPDDEPIPLGICELGPLKLDTQFQDLTLAGESLNLRTAERAVLAYLMMHHPRPVSAAELQRAVIQSSGDGGAARNQIYELRLRLSATGYPDAIRHYRGRGYALAF